MRCSTYLKNTWASGPVISFLGNMMDQVENLTTYDHPEEESSTAFEVHVLRHWQVGLVPKQGDWGSHPPGLGWSRGQKPANYLSYSELMSPFLL